MFLNSSSRFLLSVTDHLKKSMRETTIHMSTRLAKTGKTSDNYRYHDIKCLGGLQIDFPHGMYRVLPKDGIL